MGWPALTFGSPRFCASLGRPLLAVLKPHSWGLAGQSGAQSPTPLQPCPHLVAPVHRGSTASHTQALPVFCNPRSHRRRKLSQAERGLFSVICLKFYVRFTVAKRRCRQTVPSEELGSASGSAVAVPVDSSEVRGPDPRWLLRGEDS